MFAHRYTYSVILICLLLARPLAFGQNPQPPKPQSPDDVVRVFTELVQTDVMVFDKQGRFVNGLTRDNFEIKIDGQIRPIEFFEQINAGTSNEEAQLAAARGATSLGTPKETTVVPLDRGRTIFFYVDDFHLDLSGTVASKKIISNFVDKEMGQNDQAAIATATGQIGFLQQLTGDRKILQLAVNRIKARTYSALDSERPTMGEYEATLIDNNQPDVFEYFVDETIRANGREMSREMAAGIVRSRTQVILSQSALFSANMLTALERLVRNVRDLPGRKVLFFLSNGFLIQNRRGDAMTRLQRITSAAARSGVVIYSIDTRGLAVGGPDISRESNFDPEGRLSRSVHGELTATQDGLNALARDTGGRAIFNTNDFRPGLKAAIKETAVYYLLAWKPDPNNQKPGRFRNIQINIVGKPGLTARVRKGFFDVEAPPTATTAPVTKPTTPAEENKAIAAKLREAISSPFPVSGLPVTLGVNYYDSPAKGATLSASLQVPGEFLLFGERNGKTQAVLDVTGVFFNEKGQAKADFLERLVTTAPSEDEAKNYRGDITYTYPANLPPGLYQIRAAAREYKSGRAGSAHAWIEIPDLTKKQLSMSSLLLGERSQSMMKNVSSGVEVGPVLLSAGHRFKRDSTLRFIVFGYNVTLSPTDKKADLAVQVQVIRDDQPVLTTALRKVPTDDVSDLARIPYAAEIPLSDLQTGRYILQVTLIDRVSKQSTSQQTHFDIF